MAFSKCSQITRKNYMFQTIKPEAYDDDKIDSESETLIVNGKGVAKPRLPHSWIYLTMVNLMILGITVLLLLVWKSESPVERNAVLRPVSWWSPILDDIEIPRYPTMLNGTLFAKPEVSIAREEPSPENDAAWAQYEKVLTHIVSREDILTLGKDPETVARFHNDYWGMGDNAYMVQLDVMHQIHCLNLLRKAAFADYPGYNTSVEAKDDMWWIHLGHCTDMLLQNIQCNANTEVLTLAWVDDRKAPWPDFSVNRKCRDFQALVNWQRENAVDPDKFDRMPIPRDAFIWPAPWKHRDSELGHRLGQHHQQEGKGLPKSHESHQTAVM
ncbi:hypothetical protein ANOM_011107 [Aspergillus nomiae NRRL 13137]|uniref:Tat pathway signal sequence n=1 Tax=Aspergillus nomiae NRRL (strain ATCC 15546 / NRRL 13137 / CBS 260.88 / M93) TaxID=1509407 RepID=A0A0L1INR7_ASPN3|nr:uncharacterized protein ANOM_011107 [Aspergillus nomiae NRRL 13137]KNG80950.1 hypothetical protein ANOM_011107 [Aspergillus nomiae NRRL 13137]